MLINAGTERPLLSVVSPAYNEERRLPSTLERVIAYLGAQGYDSEIIVVDDGSEDSTTGVVERVAAQHPQVRLIRNDHRGKGYAVRTGVLAAEGEYILFSDADLAIPIEEVARMLPLLRGSYDIAIGSRRRIGGRYHNEPWHRYLMSRAFNWIVRLLLIGHFQDIQCGFKAFRRQVAHELFSKVRLYGEDAKPLRGTAVTGFDVEVLFLASRAGYRIAEIPVQCYYDTNTKVSVLRDSVRMFKDVLRVRLNDWRGLYDGLTQSLNQ